MRIRYELKAFSELALEELYAALKLRVEVFVVEQRCAYAECDGRDVAAHHLLGFSEGGELVAYARILPPGTVYACPAIGRVVVRPDFRGNKSGQELMGQALAGTYRLYGVGVEVRIAAQTHLRAFYERLGFLVAGEPFLEDNIPHVEMVLEQRGG